MGIDGGRMTPDLIARTGAPNADPLGMLSWPVDSIHGAGIRIGQTGRMWSSDRARDLAEELVGEMMPRWQHLLRVGKTAELLADRSTLVSDSVVVAAWLHDVGYASQIATTGFHALDGARALAERGAPSEVVGLVGHHTGAHFEAEERSLLVEWQRLPVPDRDSLDILTMIDLSVGPSGDAVLERDRVAEILDRYGEEDPVFRAVSRSRRELIASSLRGKRLLGLPDEWPIVPVEGMLQSESHRGV